MGAGGEHSKAGSHAKAGEGASADLSGPELSYLADVNLIEGHLRAGCAVYQLDEKAMAETHMKHPGDEIYGDLAPKLEERGVEGFADELTALSEAVAAGRPADAEFDAVSEKIEAARASSENGEQARLRAVPRLMHIAADEFEIGVKEGKIANLHEYQDAWGFLTVAQEEASGLAASADPAVAEAADSILPQAVKAPAVFPSVVPSGPIETDPSVLHGAATEAENAALGAFRG